MGKKSFLDRNNVKLSFYDKPKFVINREKGVVIAMLTGQLNLPVVDDLTDSTFFTTTRLKVNGIGIARLKDDDVFDVETGKKIATAKAENNAYNCAAAKLTKMIQARHEFVDCCLKFLYKTNGIIEHNVDYINRIGN